ncbi:MAG: pitrilysin family protein [Bacteroidota bacterium]|nr:insulinase family protein [Candidatus Kapabacteria bacterium]MCX7937667.1 insulinase family protein [Chlorobiota bacterium]MDW8075801.1 pitrilysin family protein [Bacteroidota bacterium]MDW8272252.1 pitrilysin family protein [Bacteroidota bacterium]
MIPSAASLPNGLRFVVLRKEGPPLVTIGVAYGVGSAHESPLQTGYAHLFEHVMFDNIARSDGKSFDELVTAAGGSSNAYTTYDWTYYHTTLPLEAIELGLELESQRMRSFVVSAESLRTQCNVVIEEIAENVFNQPYGTARMHLAAAAFEAGSCYSWDIYGSIEHLRAMTLEDARQWYERFYRPHNAVLAVVGAFDSTAEVIERIVSFFRDIPSAEQISTQQCTVVRGYKHHVERNPALPADMVIAAYHIAGMDDEQTTMTAELLATVLSAGRSSPLARRFIHEGMFAHSASAHADIRRQSSLFEFSALARDKSITAGQLLEQWEQLISSFGTMPIAPEHLERAHNKIRRRYAQAFQTTEGLAEMLALAVLLFDDPEHPWREVDKLLSISPDALQEFARTVFAQQPALVEYRTHA